MKTKPVIEKTTILAKTALFTIEGLDLRFSNGEARCYERIRGEALGAVMIVPLLDEKTLLLVREYAAGVDAYVLGFPKGAMSAFETAEQTAARELMEETGYGAKQWTDLGLISTSPGYMSSRMHILLAQSLYPASLEGDEPEPIECVPWPLADWEALLDHPEFHEARSIAALLLLQRHGLRAHHHA